MAVDITPTITTDYTGATGTNNATQTISRPSSSTTDDIVLVLRHRQSTSVALSSGTVDGNLTTNLYNAASTITLMAQYRRITSLSDQSAGWQWTSAGGNWSHAALRISGATTTGNPLTAGTVYGTGAAAGEGISTATVTAHTLTVGNASSGDLGIVVFSSNYAPSSVSTNWNLQLLADNGGTNGGTRRVIGVAWREYTGSVTADTVSLNYGSSVSVNFTSRHGVIAQQVAGGATVTLTAAQAIGTGASATITTTAGATVTLSAATAAGIASGTVTQSSISIDTAAAQAVGAGGTATVDDGSSAVTITLAAATAAGVGGGPGVAFFDYPTFTTTRPPTVFTTARPPTSFTTRRP